MNFKSLIDRYSVEFEEITSTGRYVGGEYEETLSTLEKRTGAIVSIPERKIYQSGGYLTSKDLKLYTYSPLKGTKVRYKGELYSVEDERDYSEFAGVYSYTLKWVSSFDRSDKNG